MKFIINDLLIINNKLCTFRVKSKPNMYVKDLLAQVFQFTLNFIVIYCPKVNLINNFHNK